MQLRVESMERVAPEVVSVVLTDPTGSELPAWEPGAHIDVVLGDSMIRQYSLSSDPAERGHYRVGVLLEQSGRGGSQHMHEVVEVGDLLEVRGPRNHFALEPAARYVFVAGGIGVTALLPMAAAADRAGIPFEFLYLGSSRQRMAYLDELAPFGDRVTVVARDERDRLDLVHALGIPRDDTLVYCCGPESLIAAVEEAGSTWSADAIRVERFSAPPVDLEGESALEFTEDTAFEVELAQSGQTITVRSDQTLLDALESVGADVYSDCREGICSTCETVVLDGVPDHRDHVLSAKERESCKLMMVCVSRSQSSRLVLDL